MNAEVLRQRLIRAAQALVPSERVPLFFEKRIMARIKGRTVPDVWSAWGSLLWRALVACCVLMIITGIGAMTVSQQNDDLGSRLDDLLLAGVDVASENP